MGQYFMVVNTDKKEYLMPHDFGSGLKFLEFTSDSCGVLTGLAHLLGQSSDPSGMGGANPEITGRWIGDHVVIVGDYDESQLYGTAYETYKNISNKVICHMAKDEYVHEQLTKSMRWTGGMNVPVYTTDLEVTT
jgi:hypothetical protein